MDDSRQASETRKKVYLAGPEVFLPDAPELGARKKQICLHHGFDAGFPLDVTPDPGADESDVPLLIFDICVEMMDSCDLVIANLTPFRGVSVDVGTAAEVGYMYAQHKPVFGYTNDMRDYAGRVKARRLAVAGQVVEDYGFFDNLMCEGAVQRSGGRVERRRVPNAQLFTALEGFEACVRQAALVLGVTARD
jgi:nucleoside 2-deoxyribosyltransferase